MAKSKTILPPSKTHHQPDLLSGSLAVPHALRSALVSAISASALSRYQIAARMSDLVGREVSKTMLDAYTSESKEGHRLPAELLPAFCEATGSWQPMIVLVEAIGGMILTPKEKAFVQLVKIEREKARLEKRARELREELERRVD